MSQNARPKWWQLYLTFPLLIALFMADSRLKLSVRGHQTAQIGIVLVVFGLVHLWLKANSAALSKIDLEQCHGTIKVTRIPQYQLSESNNKKRPMLQLPDSEIKGMLGDTFEMETIDAECFPIDEVSQELIKE